MKRRMARLIRIALAVGIAGAMPAFAQSQRSTEGRFLTAVFDDTAAYSPTSLDVGTDGHIVVAATVPGASSVVSAALVTRFDGTGRKLWERSPAARADLVSTVLARSAPNGETIVLHDETPNDLPQLVLLRLGANGKEIWRRPLGSGTPSDLLVEADGAVIVSGSARHEKSTAFDALALRVTPDGKIAWRRQVAGEKADSGNTADLLRAIANKQYITGGFTDIVYANNAATASRGLLVKLGSDGQVVWKRMFGNGDSLTMVASIAVSGNDIFVITLTESTGGGQFLELSRVTSDGTVSWTRPLAGPPDQEINDVAIAPGGGLVLAGSEANGDSRSAVLISIDREGVEHQRVNYRGYKMHRLLAVRPYPAGGFALLFEGAGSASNTTLYLARVDATGRF